MIQYVIQYIDILTEFLLYKVYFIFVVFNCIYVFHLL